MQDEPDHAPNPRAPRRHSSQQLTREVRQGNRYAEALSALSLRAEDPTPADQTLAAELARALVRRCDTRHEGWQTLRDGLQVQGVAVPWSRAERQAYAPTAERVLRDCASVGRTPLLRVQHAAAEERARALAAHTDPALVLPALCDPAPDNVQLDANTWAATLAAAVTARSRAGLSKRLLEGASQPLAASHEPSAQHSDTTEEPARAPTPG